MSSSELAGLAGATEGTPLSGWRFDGQTSVRHAVTLHFRGGHGITIKAPGEPDQPICANALRLDEAFENAPLIVHCPDGGHLELGNAREARLALLDAGAKAAANDGMAAVLARDWRMASAAMVFLVSAVAAFYVWLLPAVAEVGADMVPPPWKEQMSVMALKQLDVSLFTPSTLPQAKREEIESRFKLLLDDIEDGEDFKLHFRKFSEGPNAMALPGNHIILTDELIEFVDGDTDIIVGVLAHELGHVINNHGLRTLIQTSALTILGSALIGDYSSILATIPAALGHLRYSRDFEIEADLYSHKLQCAKGMDPARTAEFFERALKATGDVSDLLPAYLSSHPDSQRRAQFFRSKC